MTVRDGSVQNHPAPTPDEAAFASMADVLRLVTTLATGTLVFSIGLLSAPGINYPGWLKVVLAATWAALFLGVVAGVWTQSMLPLQLKKNILDINAPEVRYPAIVMELLFLLGILGIAITLIATLINAPTKTNVLLRSPVDAIRAASRTLPPGLHVVKVLKVELLKGFEESRNADSSWHVQVELSGDRGGAIERDLYFDPSTGKALDPEIK